MHFVWSADRASCCDYIALSDGTIAINTLCCQHEHNARTHLDACAHAWCATCVTGSFVDVPWRKVSVGQVLKVHDDELFPADLLCLHSSLPDGVCFIRTTNLDGETNLKIRRCASASAMT